MAVAPVAKVTPAAPTTAVAGIMGPAQPNLPPTGGTTRPLTRLLPWHHPLPTVDLTPAPTLALILTQSPTGPITPRPTAHQAQPQLPTDPTFNDQ